MIDPLRPGARDAVLRCRDAGIMVSMVTGDHPVTALAIARDLGLASDASEVLTASDLPADPEALGSAVGRVRFFARVAPEQELAFVRAAANAGHFVAVTGDGANDSPALRAANVGAALSGSGAWGAAWTSPSARARQPKTCPRRPSPGNRRRT